MAVFIPVVILFAILQGAGYSYVNKRQIPKGRLKVLVLFFLLYVVLALALPLTPDGEYMTRETVSMIKAGIILVGAICSLAVHTLARLMRNW